MRGEAWKPRHTDGERASKRARPKSRESSVGGLFRVLDCCAGGLARLVGVSSVPKRQRKIAERTDVDVLGKLEGKPAMLGRLIPTPSRARGAATQPGSPGAFNRGRATGERVDGWTVTAPEAPTTIPSRLPTRGVVCA